MTAPTMTKRISEDAIRQIIDQYNQPELTLSDAFPDGGLDPLWPRFQRAVINQAEEGEATVSRYAIWANTVRDNIVAALHCVEAGRDDEARRLLIRAANSLSAFSDVQACFDPLKIGKA